MIEIDPNVAMRHMAQTIDEKSSANQQHDRKSRLRRHEQMAEHTSASSYLPR